MPSIVTSTDLGWTTVTTVAAPALPGTEPHPHARAVLTAALPPGGTPSHAYLFHGPAGSGKRDVARAFAAALLADGAPDPGSTRRRVASGAHPDLTWVAPTSSAGLLVGDVDEPVVAAAAKTPFEARRRVFVIEGADELNDQAANRMLKTLEEPAPFAHLVLLTHRPGEVLETIASRCQPVRFDALAPERIAERLTTRHGVPAETADACARLALGDADRALGLALGDGPALRGAAEAFARAALGTHGSVAERPWRALLAHARAQGERAVAAVEERTKAELEFVPRKEHRRLEREAGERARRAQRRAATAALDHGLALTGLWLRDAGCVADGVPELVHATDRAAALTEDARGRPGRRLRTGQELVEDTRRRLDRNVSEELALEQLAYRLARLLG
jgi:DNA polymerase-3 subunit delta'